MQKSQSGCHASSPYECAFLTNSGNQDCSEDIDKLLIVHVSAPYAYSGNLSFGIGRYNQYIGISGWCAWTGCAYANCLFEKNPSSKTDTSSVLLRTLNLLTTSMHGKHLKPNIRRSILYMHYFTF